MLYLIRLLLLLINIDQKMILNWFGDENPNSQTFLSGNNVNFLTTEVKPISPIYLETVKLFVVE